MKILIQISPSCYDSLLNWVNHDSPAYSMLKNGVKLDHSDTGTQSETMAILCDGEQASTLFQAAKKCSPEVVYEIAKGIKIFRPE